jgi:MarR family transcriptional regulator, lower aerobic nicotinate degradation pathway regulator
MILEARLRVMASVPTPLRRERSASGGYVLTDQVGHLLRRAHQRHTALFQEMIGAAQLTPTQFAALVRIREQGELSQNELGRMAAMDPATTQGVVHRLEQRGLVRRRSDPGDKRLSLLSLTASGEALAQSAIEIARGITDATLAPLTPGEQAIFLALLKKLI